MSEYHRITDFEGHVIKEKPNTDQFFSVRYCAKENNRKVWFTVYFNNIMAAYKFEQFIQTRFGHAWSEKVDIRPDLFYESLEDVILGVFWKWHHANKKYHQYKHAKCCFEPLCKADIKKDPSE